MTVMLVIVHHLNSHRTLDLPVQIDVAPFSEWLCLCVSAVATKQSPRSRGCGLDCPPQTSHMCTHSLMPAAFN